MVGSMIRELRARMTLLAVDEAGTSTVEYRAASDLHLCYRRMITQFASPRARSASSSSCQPEAQARSVGELGADRDDTEAAGSYRRRQFDRAVDGRAHRRADNQRYGGEDPCISSASVRLNSHIGVDSCRWKASR